MPNYTLYSVKHHQPLAVQWSASEATQLTETSVCSLLAPASLQNCEQKPNGSNQTTTDAHFLSSVHIHAVVYCSAGYHICLH